jgi:SAM-dependent methyltransferase
MQRIFTSSSSVVPSPAEDRVFRFKEDLPAMAAQAYALADHLCLDCRNFHALWPYRRLARMCSAAEFGAPIIERTLRELLSFGGRHVLIAGAADSGLLAAVLRAGADLEPEITVVDRCETPLELCRQFAARWSFPLHTQRLDLVELGLRDFDIIYANEVLQHFSKDERVGMLARMRRALRPGGHLVCVFHTGAHIEGDVVREYRTGYADWLLAELERIGIPLPDSAETFRQRANGCADGLRTREGTFEEPETVDGIMKAAGFVVVERTQFAMPLLERYQVFFARLGKRRFISVAQSPCS